MALAVAMNERLGHSTSSPGLTAAASRAKCKAVVHEDTAIAKGAPTYSAKRRSNSSTRGPWLTQPLLSTSTTARSSDNPKEGRATGTVLGTTLVIPPPLRRGTLLRFFASESTPANLAPRQPLL